MAGFRLKTLMSDLEFSWDNAIVIGGSTTGLLVANLLAKEFGKPNQYVC